MSSIVGALVDNVNQSLGCGRGFSVTGCKAKAESAGTPVQRPGTWNALRAAAALADITQPRAWSFTSPMACMKA